MDDLEAIMAESNDLTAKELLTMCFQELMDQDEPSLAKFTVRINGAKDGQTYLADFIVGITDIRVVGQSNRLN